MVIYTQIITLNNHSMVIDTRITTYFHPMALNKHLSMVIYMQFTSYFRSLAPNKHHSMVIYTQINHLPLSKYWFGDPTLVPVRHL
jgi:hypothetical protein